MVPNRYSEESNYNYGTGQGSGVIGHFTQIVWKGSIEVGIGIATSGANTWVVAKYWPSGNFLNQYTDNVGYRKTGCKKVTFLYQSHESLHVNFKFSTLREKYPNSEFF